MILKINLHFSLNIMSHFLEDFSFCLEIISVYLLILCKDIEKNIPSPFKKSLMLLTLVSRKKMALRKIYFHRSALAFDSSHATSCSKLLTRQ